MVLDMGGWEREALIPRGFKETDGKETKRVIPVGNLVLDSVPV